MTARHVISADQVCAYTWQRFHEHDRAIFCALAGIGNVAAILEWYEIGEDARKKLKSEIADLIEVSANRQLAEQVK